MPANLCGLFFGHEKTRLYNCLMKKIAPDKWKHFYVGIAMGIVLQAFLLFLLKDHFVLATSISFFLVLLISYGFELFSLISGHGHYDVWDAVAGTIGGVIGIALFIFVRSIMVNGMPIPLH
jgi:glycopeptide antibiotics resistance protein